MDSSERYNRNEKKSSVSVNDEVQRLLRKNGKISSQDFLRLRSQYKDDELVNNIQALYAEKQGNIMKKAKKFAQIIREKYSQSQTPFHILLEKAYKYKVKYGLTDEEFAEFQRSYEQELVGLKSNEVIQPANNLMKVLGGVTLDYHGFQGKLDDNDYKYLQEIIKVHATSRPLHAQVLLQSMQYQDCGFEALSAEYERNLHRIGEHVHPVVAALFLPKFKSIDEFFLFSNIAGVVKCRYNGETLQSRPDYELFYALTTDPNDVVCDNRSPVLDLLNRSQLQVQLWNSVLHLRNGQVYNASFKDFIGSVDMCRLNKQDTPDLLYGRFDGVVIKRLLSAFSFRPTVVATSPVVVNNVAFNPYLLNVRPQVTSVPMINMRLPPASNNNEEIDLNSALEQHQFFLEGGAIVPRSTSLIWSRGILVFYVDRRATSITYNNHLTQFSMASLPSSIAIAGFEKLNTRPVNVPDEIPIKDEIYKLKSVVISEVNTTDPSSSAKDLVIGSSTLVATNNTSRVGSDGYVLYDPYLPSKKENSKTPFNRVDYSTFTKLCRERGNVFIYYNDSDVNGEKVLSL